jgi:hypothetical protein
MSLTQNSRRKFLTSAAILAAGCAFGAPVRLFSSSPFAAGLKECWHLFWRLQGGEWFRQSLMLNDKAETGIAKGHRFYTGEAVYFRNENLIALPLWICWQGGEAGPDDVCINFFTKGHEPKKRFSINRFELEGLHQLAIEKKRTDLVSLLNDDRKNRDRNNGQTTKLVIKTQIRSNDVVRINSLLEEERATIERKLIYRT